MTERNCLRNGEWKKVNYYPVSIEKLWVNGVRKGRYNDVSQEWLPDDDPHDGEEYQLGWNACLEYLRKKLK